MKLGSNATTDRFHRLGGWLYDRRWWVIAAWLVVVVIAGFGAIRAPEVLRGGAGGIPNSLSAKAQEWLAKDFHSPYQYPFIITVTTPTLKVEEPAHKAMLQALEDAASSQAYVTQTFGYNDNQEAALRSADGHRTFLVAGIDAKHFQEAEQRVPQLRKALEPAIAAGKAADPGLAVHITGDIPIGYDATQTLGEDTTTAEHRILPIALIFLTFAFGAVAAAGIPVVLGALSTTVALAMLWGIGQHVYLSSIAQNIAAMMGLAIGIDYALIMVSRFRESLATGTEVREAVAETVATSGQAVLYSGITVIIALLALFLPGLIDMLSLGLAGSLTVTAAVAMTLTLVPALLAVLGPRIDWPYGFSRFIGRLHANDRLWYQWAHLVMKHPWRFLVVGTVFMSLLAIPAFTVVFGQFSSKFLPPQMESGLGLLEMEKMGQAGQVYPVQFIVRRTDGKPIVDAPSLKALAGFVREMNQHQTVSKVESIVPHAGRLLMMSGVFYGGDIKKLRARFPESVSLLLSEDASATMLTLIPKSEASFTEIKAFAHQLQDRDWKQTPGFAGFEIAIGGQAPVNNDFEHAILSNMGRVIAMVFAVTFILLAWTFRSVVLPLKALFMNTLSTAASFGLLVLVFQHGFMSWAVGFPEAPGNILVPIPLIVFCLVFGLSMDYEVFLLSRIQEEYLAHGDNQKAVARGLAATSGIITNAAMIMLLVFGAFAMASVVLTKMLGFGMAVAVFLDAMIIRVMLVPSFMAIVGKWNWWPNIVPPSETPPPPSRFTGPLVSSNRE